jgi:hypothetical protein
VSTFGGLHVILDPNIGTSDGAGTNEDEIYVLAVDDLFLFEQPYQTVRFDEIGSGTLTVRLRLHAFSFFVPHRQPKSIAVISDRTRNPGLRLMTKTAAPHLHAATAAGSPLTGGEPAAQHQGGRDPDGRAVASMEGRAKTHHADVVLGKTPGPNGLSVRPGAMGLHDRLDGPSRTLAEGAGRAEVCGCPPGAPLPHREERPWAMRHPDCRRRR